MDKRRNTINRLHRNRAMLKGVFNDLLQERHIRLRLERELHACKEELYQKQKKIDLITWTISHKLRPPVATILGLAKIFNHQDKSDPDNIQVIDGICMASSDLDKIVMDMVKQARTKPDR